MDEVLLPQDYRATTRRQFTYEWPLKVSCWLNLLDIGGKYSKRYSLPKSRNSKFELLVGKFISLHFFSNAFSREVFFATATHVLKLERYRED